MKTATRFMHSAMALAIAMLFIQCKNNTGQTAQTTETPAKSNVTSSNRLPIAYVNLDSLLVKYDYAKELNEKLIRRQENARASFNEKARELDKEGAEFQRKYQNNAFLSQERLEQEQQRLLKKQQDLQTLGQRLESENMQEQVKMQMQMADSINYFIKEYKKKKKYEVILNNTSTLYIDPSYDITNEVVDMLNKRYHAKK